MQKSILILLNYFLMKAYSKNIQVDLFLRKDCENNVKGRTWKSFISWVHFYSEKSALELLKH